MAKNSKSKKLRAKSLQVFGAKNDVRVAAVLGKTHAARAFLPEDIARDAMTLSRFGQKVRAAIEGAKPTDKLASQAQSVAERYNAEIVSRSDLDGIILGLRFLDGSFADMGRGIFRIS